MKCVICRKVSGTHYSAPYPSPLPKVRLQESPPFTATGIDFTGALYVKDNNAIAKVYMFIYMCVFKSCAPRGCIRLNWGFIFTSFFMLYKQKIYTQIDNIEQCINNCSSLGGITKLVPIRKFGRNTIKLWYSMQFYSEGSPWYGGWWERLIAPTKNNLKENSRITEIGKNLNNRPLTDINDSESLTPSHLLYGRITSLAYLKIEIEESNIPVCMETSMLTKRAQILNTVLEHFWTRWKSEYLTSSREYHKTSRRNDQTIQIGDIVQVHDRRHVQNDKMAAS